MTTFFICMALIVLGFIGGEYRSAKKLRDAWKKSNEDHK